MIAPTGSRYPRYLLDLDPDLAGEMDVQMRQVARRAATAVVFAAGPGNIDLGEWLAITTGGPGLLVLAGTLVSHARVLDRVVAEIVGSGDLVQPPGVRSGDEFLECDFSSSVLQPARFAILDARFADQVRRWPQVTHALLRRAERRANQLSVQRAITAQPRLEVRLVLLLWHLAARWGKVEPGGVRLPLPLTHALLGRLVAAERPSVTHALKRLAVAGSVTGGDDGWHLHGTLQDHLCSLGGGENQQRLMPDLVAHGGREGAARLAPAGGGR